MFGIDLIVVSLWFLPVTLFIILPLTVSCLWGVVSLVTSPFRQAAAHSAGPLAAAEPV